jgi:hypothetical protein
MRFASSGVFAPVTPQLDFIWFIWGVAVICLVSMFAASIVFPMAFLIALLWAFCMLVCIPLVGTPQQAIALAVSFVVIFNAAYMPVFGFFQGINGAPSRLYMIALGLRSAWYAGALLVVAGFILKADRKQLGRGLIFTSVVSLFMLMACFAISSTPLDVRGSYLVNSYLPLVLTLFCLGAVCALPPLSFRDGLYLSRIVWAALIASAVYFVVLPFFYDVFRPDLASYHRARPGTYIPYGGYDIAWGTRIEGVYFNRFVASFPDPIVAGYFFASLSFAMYVAKMWRAFALLAVLLLLSLSKGAWLCFFQAAVLYWLGRKSLLLLWPAVFVMLAFLLGLNSLIDASNRVHFNGLVGGFLSIFQGGMKALLVGFGMGDGGNMGRGYVAGGSLAKGWLGSGSESGIGVLVHQLGMIGLAGLGLLVASFYSTAMKAVRAATDEASRNSIIAVVALYLSLLLNTPLQENCINASILSSILLGSVLIRSLMAGKSETSG